MAVNLWICSALVAAGIGLHFLTKLYELEQQGLRTTPMAYWRQQPYSALTVVVSAYLLMLLLWYVGELTYAAAVLIGVSANSAGDKLRARAQLVK